MKLLNSCVPYTVLTQAVVTDSSYKWPYLGSLSKIYYLQQLTDTM
ncbi:MAG: hypothetical protein [Caudoviricetes sp.]|nr:MAG: hypothetical protein [Caudoviricetes sp.]